MNIDAQWIVGFVDAEGCFTISINKHMEIKHEFTIELPKRDVQLLFALKSYFKCGIVRKACTHKMLYRVKEAEHLLENIIPFFEKHLLKSKKHVAFQKFRKILLKIHRNHHLTTDGIAEVRNVANQMKDLQTKIESDSFGNRRD